uniref:Leucine-rich repeat-containing protein 3 n=2 Tax=Tetraodon nigroviridis TaxID=99883 RepID=H3CTZ0_TETNG
MDFVEKWIPSLINPFALLWSLLLATLISNPPVMACPSSCHCMEKSGMTVVQCKSRSLDKIPSDLPKDTTVLLLGSNHITHIPNQAFRELHYLQELDLSNNDIDRVEVGAFQGVFDSLLVLDLSNNRIQSVPKEAFSRLSARINLSNNPWFCECTLQEVLRELQLDPETVNEVICHTAAQEEYAGKPVIQVLDSGINFCNFHHKTTDIAMFVTMFGWFTMVIAYVIYYVRHNQEDARRHLEYLKSLPSSSQISKDFDTISTVL